MFETTNQKVICENNKSIGIAAPLNLQTNLHISISS